MVAEITGSLLQVLGIILFLIAVSLPLLAYMNRRWPEEIERSPEWYEAMRELDILDGTILPDLDEIAGPKPEPKKVIQVSGTRGEELNKLLIEDSREAYQKRLLERAIEFGLADPVYEMGSARPVDYIIYPEHEELIVKHLKAEYNPKLTVAQVEKVYHPKRVIGIERALK